MTREAHEILMDIGDRLVEIERRLKALTEEVQRSGLAEEKADELLDRLDEMMDLLYFIDERLERIGDGGAGS